MCGRPGRDKGELRERYHAATDLGDGCLVCIVQDCLKVQQDLAFSEQRPVLFVEDVEPVWVNALESSARGGDERELTKLPTPENDGVTRILVRDHLAAL